MAEVPDYVTDKTARAVRNFFYIVGGVSGLSSYSSFSNDESGWFAALVAAGAFWIATKIVVHRPLKGSVY
jgi:hypothetical protein